MCWSGAGSAADTWSKVLKAKIAENFLELFFFLKIAGNTYQCNTRRWLLQLLAEVGGPRTAMQRGPAVLSNACADLLGDRN